MIRYKVQCQGITGDENRRPRAGSVEAPAAQKIGTFLCVDYTQARRIHDQLLGSGLAPKVVRL